MDEITSLVFDHWPFWAAVGVFWVIGHFVEKSVFTKARAYEKGRFQWFWWWGRESLELHPIIAGVLLGQGWTDPEGRGWSGHWEASAYFASAGVVSLFGWLIVTKILERMGLKTDLKLPGESDPPSKP